MDFQTELTELFQEWEASGVVVTDDGIFPFGMADRAAGRETCREDSYPLALDAPFFLAMLAGRLAERGALSFRAPVSRWLPELKGLPPLTLSGLLEGRPLADYWGRQVVPALERDPDFQALSQEEQELLLLQKRAAGLSAEAVLSFLQTAPPEEEDETDFSRTHQTLLAEILRRVSGSSIARLAREELFAPLGILPAEAPTAAGWSRYADGPLRPRPPLDMPDGCCLTGEQAGTLARAMAEGKLLSPAVWQKLWKSPAFFRAGAVTMASCPDLYGRANFYFLPRAGRWAVWLSNESPAARFWKGGMATVAYPLRLMLEARLLPFTAPRLEPYCRKNWRQIFTLALAEQQNDFVGDPQEAICEAYVNRKLHPYLLTDLGKGVGMVVLYADRRKGEFRIQNLLVSLPYQGRGYGKALLAQAMERIRDMGAETVTLEVERKNLAARRLYEQAGFAVRHEDEEELVLERTLA